MFGIFCVVLLAAYGIGIIMYLVGVLALVTIENVYDNLPKVYNRFPRICAVTYLVGYIFLWPAVLLIYLLEKPEPRQ